MRLIIFTFMALIFFACGEKPGEKDVSQQANFGITELSLESQKDKSLKYSFPRFEKQYQVSAVIVDTSSNLFIPNEEFVVDMGSEGKINVTSDSLGKIIWNENVSYYITGDKKKILVERKIFSKSEKQLIGTAVFLLYPYAPHLNEDVSEFSRLTDDQKTIYTDKLTASRRPKGKYHLELKNSSLDLTYLGPTQRGGDFRFKISGNIIAGLKLQNGEPFDYHLKKGEFSIRLDLTTKSGAMIYTRHIDDALLENENLVSSFHDVINMTDNYEDIHLNIFLQSHHLGHEFQSFHGRVKLGKISDLANSHELRFSKRENSRFSDFRIMKHSKAHYKSLSDRTLKFDKLTLEYDMIEDGETPTVKSIIYRSKTCVKDFYEDRVLAYETFSIKKATGETIQETTDSEGCLFWNENIKFKYYKPEKFVRRENFITHVKSKISKKLTSYINPWTILTIGRDEREMDGDTLQKISNREDVFSRLFLEQYSFETTGVTYHMDQFMTLFVRKNIRLDLEFEVTRYSSLTEGINAKEDIRDGVYLLKVALEKNYIDTRKTIVDVEQTNEKTVIKKSLTRKPIEYIYVVNKLVRVWNGHIITPIELSIHDLRLMTVRTNFLVQIQTIDQGLLDLSKNFDIKEISTERILKKLKEKFPSKEASLDLLVDNDSGLPSRTFEGPMILLEMEGGADVRPTDAINQCFTDDCNFLERNNENLGRRLYGHDKKYFGGTDHLVNITVDDLLKQKKVLDKKYLNQKRVESLIVNYLETFNLKYVSDKDEDLLSLPRGEIKTVCESSDIRDCFVTNNARKLKKDHFLSLFEDKKGKKAFKNISDLFLSDGKDLKQYSKSLCQTLLEDVKMERGTPVLSELSLRLKKNKMWNDVFNLCQDEVAFSFNKVIRTGGVDKFSFLGGKTINFDLGSADSVEYSEAFSTDAQISAELIPLGPISKVSDILGLGVAISGAAGTEFSYGDSSELTSATYLAMQRATFDIKFLEPTICMEIRVLPDFIRALYKVTQKYKKLTFDFKSFTEGFLVCNHQDSYEINHKIFREHYYYFAQHFTEGHMLDDGSILNHPWLLGLRGERDYKTFVNLLGIKPTTQKRDIGMITSFFQKGTSWYLDDQDKLSASFTENDVAFLPLDQISGAFDNALPSFPGIYVLTPQKKEYPYD